MEVLNKNTALKAATIFLLFAMASTFTAEYPALYTSDRDLPKVKLLKEASKKCVELHPKVIDSMMCMCDALEFEVDQRGACNTYMLGKMFDLGMKTFKFYETE